MAFASPRLRTKNLGAAKSFLRPSLRFEGATL
jgi:hypothetical protein